METEKVEEIREAFVPDEFDELMREQTVLLQEIASTLRNISRSLAAPVSVAPAVAQVASYGSAPAPRLQAQPVLKPMYPAVCSQCGQNTTVPFRPNPARPVTCLACFKAANPMGVYK